ncbi:MAG TPA: TonB-dependent receptor [Caulobacteraceae bacterium]|nr:TonB-dependent receptor [Caulobacteraceae bacterium]
MNANACSRALTSQCPSARRWGAALGLGFAALASAARAEPAEVVITAHPPAENLTHVSTAGSRLGLTPLETPATVQVISGDQIRNWALLTVNDAVSRAPGVTANGTPGNGGQTYAVRGFYGPNSVAQLYRGVQLFNAGGVVSFPFDPWNVESIEMLYGPASVLYGAGAIGGAINVVPRSPDMARWSHNIELGGGSYNTFHQALDSTGPLGRGLAYRFDISNQTSNGWVQNSKSSSTAATVALKWEITPQLSVTLSDDFGDIRPSSYEGTPIINSTGVSRTNTSQIVPGTQFLNYNIHDAFVEFKENRVFLNTDWSPTEKLSFTNALYDITQYRRYNDAFSFTYVPATQSVKRGSYRDIHANQYQYGDHAAGAYKDQLFGLKNEAVLGFDINHSHYDRYDNGNISGTSTVNALIFAQGPFSAGAPSATLHQYILTLDQYDVFAEDRVRLTDRLSVVMGGRSDHYRVNRLDFVAKSTTVGNYQSTGWHIGTVYQPIKNLSFFAQYSVATDPVTSFASQGVSSFPFSLSPGAEWEAGIKQSTLNGAVQWTFDAYSIVKKNLQTVDQNNPGRTIQVGQQSSRGVEGSLVWRVNKQVSVDANGTILNARFDSFNISSGGKSLSLAGYRPFLIPTSTANIHGNWDFLPGWQVRGGVQYVSDRYADNTDISHMPAYTTLELGLRWIPMPGLKFDLRVANVTNLTYAATNATGNTTQWVLGEPRNFMLSVNKAF